MTQLGALLYDTAVTSVSVAQRDKAKVLFYGLLYGAGTHKLAVDTGQDETAVARLSQRLKQSFPKVFSYHDKLANLCRQRGGEVVTLLGRRRRLPGLLKTGDPRTAAARRQALNTLCQGSAADVIKVAMVKIHSQVRAEEDQRRKGLKGGRQLVPDLAR